MAGRTAPGHVAASMLRAPSPADYLFSIFPGLGGRNPPIGVGDGNGVGRGGAPNAGGGEDGIGRGIGAADGAADGIGRETTGVAAGWLGRGAGWVNGAIGGGFGAWRIATAGLTAKVFAFTLTARLAFLAVFFAATRRFALFLTADFPFFLRSRIARFDFFTFDFDFFFAFRVDVLAMIAS